MHVLNVSTLPIYLPFDTAQVPFGDPLSDLTCTSASPGVLAAPGYNAPVAGDIVQLSAEGAGAALPGGFSVATNYYVVSPSGGNFSLSATKGGSAINTTTSGVGTLTLHLVSAEVIGTRLPFKPTGTVVVLNLTTNSTTLQGANDTGTDEANPSGPGSYGTILTLAGAAAGIATINNDWIRVTASGSLVLLQI